MQLLDQTPHSSPSWLAQFLVALASPGWTAGLLQLVLGSLVGVAVAVALFGAQLRADRQKALWASNADHARRAGVLLRAAARKMQWGEVIAPEWARSLLHDRRMPGSDDFAQAESEIELVQGSDMSAARALHRDMAWRWDAARRSKRVRRHQRGFRNASAITFALGNLLAAQPEMLEQIALRWIAWSGEPPFPADSDLELDAPAPDANDDPATPFSAWRSEKTAEFDRALQFFRTNDGDWSDSGYFKW